MAFYTQIFSLLLLAIGLGPVRCLKILLVPTMPTSHVLELAALGEGLVQRGHSVSITCMDSFHHLQILYDKGLDVVLYPGPTSPDERLVFSEATSDHISDIIFEKNDKYALMGAAEAATITLRDCEYMLNHQPLIDQITRAKFDIAVVDAFELGCCTLLVPHVLGIPYVSAFSGVINPWAYRIPTFPSFSPMQITWYSANMTYFQRVWNLALLYAMEAFPLAADLRNVTLIHKYDRSITSWGDLKRKSLLFFIFKDHLLEFPDASMPHIIRTPGITIREGRPLEGQFKAIYEIEKPIVLVSFGTTGCSFPNFIVRKLITAFEKFPQYTFIMRLGNSTINRYKAAELPISSNVHVFNWIPQQDILARSKTLLFITHGGNMGQWESLFHAVPMLCMPVFAEQPHNCVRMRDKGFGVILDIYEFEPNDLVKSIVHMTSTNKYKTAIQHMSTILRSNPDHPVDTVSYWLEHVNRFGGEHLRSHALEMPLHKFLMFDVIMGLFVFLLLTLCLLDLILCRLLRKAPVTLAAGYRVLAATIILIIFQSVVNFFAK